MPADKRLAEAWATAKQCVWEGPDWLRSKQRLNIAPYRGLEALFKSILNIPNASLSDVLRDLSMMKEEKRGNIAEAVTVYHHIWHEYQSSYTEELREELR